MIAALYVQRGGVYFDLDGVDPWDEARDARKYTGPHRVIAHPPCERWGRYWSGGPSVKVRRELGDDEGCFRAALKSVRKWGGVLEHPEASHAWAAHGIRKPPKSGGWLSTACGGWTCCVEQGHYGHLARKATWLYAFGIATPELKWGPAPAGRRIDPGFHSKAERNAATLEQRTVKRLSKQERIETPPAFLEVLLTMARSANDLADEVTS